MFRNELKFIINKYQQQVLSNKLGCISRKDSFCDEFGGYRVSSLYFDDYVDSAVEDKLAGIYSRKKFRIRIYNLGTDNIKLERKIKKDNVCIKDSIPLSIIEYNLISRGEVGFLKDREDPLAQDFYYLYNSKHLRPKVIVDYWREAFVYQYGDVRITLDSDLRSSLGQTKLFSNEQYIPALAADKIILEVKYTGYLPSVIRNSIQCGNLTWQSMSKYTHCRILE